MVHLFTLENNFYGVEIFALKTNYCGEKKERNSSKVLIGSHKSPEIVSCRHDCTQGFTYEPKNTVFVSSILCFTFPRHPKAHFSVRWKDELQQLQVTFYQLRSIQVKTMSPFQ